MNLYSNDVTIDSKIDLAFCLTVATKGSHKEVTKKLNTKL